MIPGCHRSAAQNPEGASHDALVVHLTLLNLADAVHADDSKATNLVGLVQHDVLGEAVAAKKFLAGEQPAWEDSQFIQHQVLRFLQPKDKYAAFASLLLKSKAFHSIQQKSASLSAANTDDANSKSRTPVDLPRTQHKKPFIPVPDKEMKHCRISKEEDIYPISISHQHPFVGIAQLDMDVNRDGRKYPILVGMDIVVFDEYNKRLYSDEEEFLEVFQNSFTDREWSLIQAQSTVNGRLQEFYIRWSMKEAYTKALGVGMGIDFSSFDLIFPEDNDSEERGGGLGETSGVFTSMNESGKESYRQRGTLEHLKQEEAKEFWDFAFLPLYDTSSSSEAPRGCACVCAGPFPPVPHTQPRLQVSVDWTDLSSLMQWHRTVK